MGFLNKLFGNTSDKEVKRVQPIVDKVLALDETMQDMTDEALRAKTTEFKERLDAGETLDDILPEAFAVVREAADPNSAAYIPPEKRIVVFDFDGTLYGERFPTYFDTCLFLHTR